MAPITDEVVNGLKDTIGKLEARVEELEGRLSNQVKPKSVAEQMRIILMGPPGAGMFSIDNPWTLFPSSRSLLFRPAEF